jgi:dihydroorotase
MKEIIIEANFATTTKVSREQIVIHPKTGLILEVGRLGVASQNVDYLFDDQFLGFAGLGDIHIHAREDVSGSHLYKEDFCSAGEAAINGGVTHVADMPNNPIPPIDDESYRKKLALTLKAPISYLLYAGVGPKTNPLSVPVPYKVYMGPSIGELYFKNYDELHETMSRYENQNVSFHCEDPEILEMHKHESLHQLKRPSEAEYLATEQAIELISKYKLTGKLCHYSTGAGLELIKKAQKKGISVSAEATPQHLYFSYDKIDPTRWVEFQMNPPLRSDHDSAALLAAIKDGTISYLATDHAPHTHEEKLKGTSGLTGLDTFGPFMTWLLKEGISPQILARVASENPGTFVNQFLPTLIHFESRYQSLGLGFGFLKAGFVGHLTLLDLKSSLKVTSSFLKTKVKHSPFLDITFPGRVGAVFMSGKKVL